MRTPERIDNFLKLINLDKLAKRWWILPDLLKLNIYNEKVTKYWKENPDQRIGQVLINLQLIPNNFSIWNDEEDEILINQGIPPEKYLFWTSLFDKNGNTLKEPITKLIEDLDATHIHNILTSKLLHLSDIQKKAFNNELKTKNENMDN